MAKLKTTWGNTLSLRTFMRVAAAVAVLAIASAALGQGIALRGVSAVNDGMAGAATGCPLDATGAIHWNPASISGLPASEMTFGMALILPSTKLSSTAAAGASGPRVRRSTFRAAMAARRA